MQYNIYMENNEGFFREFSNAWQRELRNIWEQLPEEQRRDLEHTLGRLPGNYKGWLILIDEAMSQFRVAAGDKREVAIVGPVNTGKSTLYNRLIQSKAEKTKVSAVPGTTRRAVEGDAGIFDVIDTPGADAIGAVGQEEKDKALNAARKADFLIVLFDATHGIRNAQRELFMDLVQLGKPLVVGLNKIDLIRKEKKEIKEKACNALDLDKEQIIALSAKKGEGIEELLMAVAKSEPSIVAALGSALPEYRRRLTQEVILKAISTAAAIGATPLPIVDFIPLTAIQCAMVVGIARIYNYQITFSRAKELAATFGFAMLGRTIFYEISKLGGPPGWAVAAAVAAGTTAAMGYAAEVWFERGERLSRQTVAQIAKAVSEVLIDRLKDLGRRKPRKIEIRERVNEILGSLPPEAGIYREINPTDLENGSNTTE